MRARRFGVGYRQTGRETDMTKSTLLGASLTGGGGAPLKNHGCRHGTLPGGTGSPRSKASKYILQVQFLQRFAVYISARVGVVPARALNRKMVLLKEE